MNKKGFTLIELIAMMTVLGILMAIAVPNMAGILKNSKDNITIEDVNKMLGSARTKFETKEAVYPKKNNECVVMTLGFIDSNSDFKKGMNDGVYSKTKSYVIVKKSKITEGGETGKYKYSYFMRIVEEDKNKNKQYEIRTFEYDDFIKKTREYLENTDITEIKDAEDITKVSAGQLKFFVNGAKLSEDQSGTRNKSIVGCNEVLKLYK